LRLELHSKLKVLSKNNFYSSLQIKNSCYCVNTRAPHGEVGWDEKGDLFMSKVTAEMVSRCMGANMRLFDLLRNEIIAQGGTGEELMFLTRPRFEKHLMFIARSLVNCDWRIPVSEIKKLALKAYRREAGQPSDPQFASGTCWVFALDELGIPYDTYSDVPDNGAHPMIPPVLKKKIQGVSLAHPTRIGDRVIVDLHFVEGYNPGKGELMDSSKIEQIALVHERFFDFSK